MLIFLQSHLALAVGFVLTLIVVGARAVGSDSQFRKDLGGALGFLMAFLVLRAADGELGALLHRVCV